MAQGECTTSLEPPPTKYSWTFTAPDLLYVINSISPKEYFLVDNGKATLNTKCITMASTGKDLNLKTIPKNSVIVCETEPDVFPQACCLKYFSNSNCAETAGQYRELCTGTGKIVNPDGGPFYRAPIDIKSWSVSNCQGFWTGQP